MTNLEGMLQNMMKNLNNIIEEEVQSKTCIHLDPESKTFLKFITCNIELKDSFKGSENSRLDTDIPPDQNDFLFPTVSSQPNCSTAETSLATTVKDTLTTCDMPSLEELDKMPGNADGSGAPLEPLAATIPPSVDDKQLPNSIIDENCLNNNSLPVSSSTGNAASESGKSADTAISSTTTSAATTTKQDKTKNTAKESKQPMITGKLAKAKSYDFPQQTRQMSRIKFEDPQPRNCPPSKHIYLSSSQKKTSSSSNGSGNLGGGTGGGNLGNGVGGNVGSKGSSENHAGGNTGHGTGGNVGQGAGGTGGGIGGHGPGGNSRHRPGNYIGKGFGESGNHPGSNAANDNRNGGGTGPGGNPGNTLNDATNVGGTLGNPPGSNPGNVLDTDLNNPSANDDLLIPPLDNNGNDNGNNLDVSNGINGEIPGLNPNSGVPEFPPADNDYFNPPHEEPEVDNGLIPQDEEEVLPKVETATTMAGGNDVAAQNPKEFNSEDVSEENCYSQFTNFLFFRTQSKKYQSRNAT